jgi:hypothetical protein
MILKTAIIVLFAILLSVSEHVFTMSAIGETNPRRGTLSVSPTFEAQLKNYSECESSFARPLSKSKDELRLLNSF